MNRNVESHFSQLPSVDIQRSIFNRDFDHLTTFNVGELVPVFCQEVLPGDTLNITTSKVVRLQTLLTPPFSNLYLDTYFFFTPNRILWNHWQEFCGENKDSAWAPDTTYSMPKIAPPEGGFASGTIADYLGLPVGVEFNPGDPDHPDYRHYPTSLPFRAYGLICNEFFRDENLTDPLNIPLGDALQHGSNGSDYINDVANGGKPFIAAKFHDLFTSCLPQPQKGQQISVPLPNFPGGTFPVLTSADSSPFTDLVEPLRMYQGIWSSSEGYHQDSSNTNGLATSYGVDNHRLVGAGTADPTSSGRYFFPSNLSVTVPGSTTTPLSINDLRLAFAAQKMLERNARGGTRYREILLSHFGVRSPDARLQIPEYLGGNRIPIQVHQVTNTAQSEQDFLGDLGAMSYTTDIHDDVSKSFTEHGYVLGLCVARYDHSYSQGLSRMWTRNDFTDFFLPVFSNIGEQPLYQSELFCDGNPNPNVFGYNEAWAEYRYAPNMITGEMRPGIPNSLASWHFGDFYETAPTLSDSWIREDKTNVDRTLAVTSMLSNQIMLDVFFKSIWTRPMPMYSIPGLIDHN